MEASGHGHSLVYSVSVGMFSVRLTTRWYQRTLNRTHGTSALSVLLRTYLRSPSIQANGRDLMPPFGTSLMKGKENHNGRECSGTRMTMGLYCLSYRQRQICRTLGSI